MLYKIPKRRPDPAADELMLQWFVVTTTLWGGIALVCLYAF